MSPGRAEQHGFEYVRHGTLSLYAALDIKTGRVLGDTVPRHTSVAFVTFLDALVRQQRRRRPIHIVLDNLSAHETKGVQAWLAAHPRVTLHYTPTMPDWLNEVELWFPKVERDRHRQRHFHVHHGPAEKALAVHQAAERDVSAVHLTLQVPQPQHPSNPREPIDSRRVSVEDRA